MTDEPPPPRWARSHWWLVPAFVLLLSATPAVLAGVAAAAVLARVGLRVHARWRAARTERSRTAAGLAAGAIALAVDPAGRTTLLGERELAAHGLVLGASGAGKTTTVLRILTERIRAGAPVVAVDLKGSPAFAGALAAAAAASGREFRLWTPDGPATWNPLAHGGATECKDKLIATERFTEPHYQRAAERYVQLAVRCLQETAPGRPPTLAGVVALLDPRRLGAAAARLEPDRRAALREYLAGLSPDQLSAVRGLASRLAVITESDAGRWLGAPDGPGAPAVDLRAALAGPGREVVVFSLNSSTYGALAAQLGTLAVQDLVAAAGHRLAAGPAAQALVAIDEFSALGSDHVLALLARGREAGVSVVLATQELADLDRAGRGFRDQVLGNTAVKIAHRQDVPASAEAVARLAGAAPAWERSYRLDPGRPGRQGGAAQTLRPVRRLAVDPERVRTLPTGEALVIVKTPRASARLTRVLAPARDQPPPGITR